MSTVLFSPLLVVLLTPPAPAQEPLLGGARQMIPVEEDADSAVSTADFDGDGDVDVLSGTTIDWNDGNGIFTQGTPLVGEGQFDCTTVFDMDGDGDPDVFAGHNLLPGSLLFENDGAGNLTEVGMIQPPLGGPDEALAVDFDGDGDLDLFVGLETINTDNQLLLNDGAGIFADVSGQLPSLPTGGTWDLAGGDVDGDGDTDVWVANWGANDSQKVDRLLLNDGAATFSDATATHLPTPSRFSPVLLLGDLTGNGALDAMHFGQDISPMEIQTNDGSGVFSLAPGALPSPPAADTGLLIDADDDGDLDILALGRDILGGNAPRLFENDGAGGFSDASANVLASPLAAQAASAADFDGDGDLDVYIGDFRQDRLLLGSGDGRFVDATGDLAAINASGSTKRVALGDVDGDGDLDAAVVQAALQAPLARTHLLLNDGAARFTAAPSAVPDYPTTPREIELADLSGDGALDIYIADEGDDSYWVNDGSGVFTDESGSLPVSTNTLSVELVDFGGDGDLDIFRGTASSEVLLLNDGAGNFSDGSSIVPSETSPTWGLVCADLSGNGFLDAFLGDGMLFATTNALLLSNGTTLINATAQKLPLVSTATFCLAAGDVDGDGDLDVFEGTSHSADGHLYLNDGTAKFTDASQLLPVLDPVATHQAQFVDLDADGDVDLLTADYTTSRVLLNDGSGTFQSVPGGTLERRIEGLAAGDLDGDADVDVFLAGQYWSEVLYQRARQINRVGLPRVGKPLDLVLDGPASTVWGLFYAFGGASVTIPPHGTLYLDPFTLTVVGAGALDAGGKALLSLPVPNQAGLIGADVHWQAVVGLDLLLTNPEVTTFTDF